MKRKFYTFGDEWWYVDENGHHHHVCFIIPISNKYGKIGMYEDEDFDMLIKKIERAESVCDRVEILTVYHGLYIATYNRGNNYCSHISTDRLFAIGQNHEMFNTIVVDANNKLVSLQGQKVHDIQKMAREGIRRTIHEFIHNKVVCPDGQIAVKNNTMYLTNENGTYKLVGVIPYEEDVPYAVHGLSNYHFSKLVKPVGLGMVLMYTYHAIWEQIA